MLLSYFQHNLKFHHNYSIIYSISKTTQRRFSMEYKHDDTAELARKISVIAQDQGIPKHILTVFMHPDQYEDFKISKILTDYLWKIHFQKGESIFNKFTHICNIASVGERLWHFGRDMAKKMKISHDLVIFIASDDKNFHRWKIENHLLLKYWLK